MQMISDIMAMNGYELYIWAAYGTATAILLGLLIIFRRQLRNSYKQISELEKSSRQRPREKVHGEDGST